MFDKHKHELESRYYLGFEGETGLVAIMALRKMSDRTSEIFCAAVRKAAAPLIRYIRDNLNDMWELMDCEKLTTFTRDDNKPSLHINSAFGFKRVGFIENYGTEDGKSYGMVIKQLNRGQDGW